MAGKYFPRDFFYNKGATMLGSKATSKEFLQQPVSQELAGTFSMEHHFEFTNVCLPPQQTQNPIMPPQNTTTNLPSSRQQSRLARSNMSVNQTKPFPTTLPPSAQGSKERNTSAHMQ